MAHLTRGLLEASQVSPSRHLAPATRGNKQTRESVLSVRAIQITLTGHLLSRGSHNSMAGPVRRNDPDYGGQGAFLNLSLAP